jgi:hypothetical protein
LEFSTGKPSGNGRGGGDCNEGFSRVETSLSEFQNFHDGFHAESLATVATASPSSSSMKNADTAKIRKTMPLKKVTKKYYYKIN